MLRDISFSGCLRPPKSPSSLATVKPLALPRMYTDLINESERCAHTMPYPPWSMLLAPMASVAKRELTNGDPTSAYISGITRAIISTSCRADGHHATVRLGICSMSDKIEDGFDSRSRRNKLPQIHKPNTECKCSVFTCELDARYNKARYSCNALRSITTCADIIGLLLPISNIQMLCIISSGTAL